MQIHAYAEPPHVHVLDCLLPAVSIIFHSFHCLIPKKQPHSQNHQKNEP